jgi:hypothetical protein
VVDVIFGEIQAANGWDWDSGHRKADGVSSYAGVVGYAMDDGEIDRDLADRPCLGNAADEDVCLEDLDIGVDHNS